MGRTFCATWQKISNYLISTASYFTKFHERKQFLCLFSIKAKFSREFLQITIHGAHSVRVAAFLRALFLSLIDFLTSHCNTMLVVAVPQPPAPGDTVKFVVGDKVYSFVLTSAEEEPRSMYSFRPVFILVLI